MKSPQHLLLRDTRGNFYLGIRLPTRNYQLKEDPHKKAQKKWRRKNPHYHTNYSREWKRQLPPNKKEYYRLQKLEYMKAVYYPKNRKTILAYHKKYYRNKKKGN